ncbi:hypothetical protein P171DRAFT_430502 [Karstenula rhodostoma CBS 690.94]|uniref:F-box domain-containing protein n=1 Tax=Karstenula rhodostoma CBS 690.94 TaxID=1392251 RepID=A0A9P4PN60_9PLEO|nr:hypothetical protein P171DRAFT_430502 [Karstenula rhodostoma CBS 690.94]
MAPRLRFLTGCFGWQPTELSRCNEVATRAWMWTIHLILVIPTAMAAFTARSNYLLVKRYPQLSQHPYNPKMGLSFLMTYIGCVILFPWVFLATLLLKKWYGSWTLLYGIANLALAITITMGVSMQAQFLPASLNGCKGGKAMNWQVVDGYPSMFTLAADLDRNNVDKAEAICKNMVAGWTVATAVVFFQFLLAYISVFFDEREFSLLNPIRPFVWLLFIIIAPFLLVRDGVLPRIRLWLSYTRKGVAELRSTKDLQVPPQTQFIPQYQSFEAPKSKLTDVLAIEHVLLNMVDYLHFEDVVNLSLTCRAVREVVYPPRDLDYRVPKLTRHCCSIAEESKCLYCNNKICGSCQRNPLWPGLSGRRHVTGCKPYCESCYYKSFARHPRGYKKTCKCYITDRSNEFQDVCRSCMDKHVDTLQAERHKRYHQEVRDIAYKENSKCGSCKMVLKDGMRWWKCGKCGGECRDEIHPAFVKRKKEKDFEKGDVGNRETDEDGSWWRRWRNVLVPRRQD